MLCSNLIKYLFPALITLAACATSSAQTTSTEKNNEIVFVSDTQGPIWLEKLWLKPNNNRLATQKIFQEIGTRKPTAVYILGDVVSKGFSSRQWRPIDGYLQELRSNGTTVSAVLGNHDILWFSKKGIDNFEQRFPEHVRTGYVQVKDSVAIVLLNSNFNILSDDEMKYEEEWYRSTLEKLDADSSIQFIITGCHHSPYSNSKGKGYASEVQNKFAKWFLKSPKSKLFVSGHTHSFEHFQVQGKDFMVIGGGGGLHQELKKTGCINDLQKEYKPMFHYLSVTRSANNLFVKSIELAPDFQKFDEGLTMTINKGTKSNTATLVQDATASLSAKSEVTK